MRNRGALAVVAVAAAIGACSKASGEASGRPHAAGTVHTDHVAARWKNEGVAPDGWKDTDPAPHGAVTCAQGRVGGVEALVCEFAADDALDRAQSRLQSGWNKQDLHTAVVTRNGRTLLAVVDRVQADPGGKIISKLLTSFSTARP